MKTIVLFIVLLLSITSFGQNNSFTEDEFDKVESQKVSSCYVKKSIIGDEIEFYSPKIVKLPVSEYAYGKVTILRFFLKKVNGDIFIDDMMFKQRITLNSVVIDYDKVICVVGSDKDVSDNTAKEFEFNVTKETDGSTIIKDVRVAEMFNYSLSGFKKITFYYVNSNNNKRTKFSIQASKVKSKFKGIIESYNILKSVYKPYELGTNGVECDEIITAYDKFENDSTYKTSYAYDVQFLKHVNNNQETFYLSLRTIGHTVVVDGKGVIILLANNKRIERKDVDIEVRVDGDANYEYSAFIRLTSEELSLLRENEITDYRLYIYDTAVAKSLGLKLRGWLNCLF
jgi:hypothetical protein